MSGDHQGVQAPHTDSHVLPLLSLNLTRVVGILECADVRAEFQYDPDTPLLVALTFVLEDGPRIVWHVGRDLLHEGLHTMSGIGDIQVWPGYPAGQESAWLQISSYGATALFQLPVPPLAQWLAYTYRLVPAGTEASRLGTDEFLAGLFDGPEPSAG
ncbi:SsgA family sporulation/cell division regulator [Streptomyces sp. NPDC006617]|uniref:SsgA family sporulation/cell division regulator n=1 Tax=Streptomyces sp. NPDC006617 TaxID=3155354 RepID=UPI0033B5A20F